MTYTCKTCHGVNSTRVIHCHYCGTVPAKYSLLGTDSVIKEGEYLSRYLPIGVAREASRQERYRHARVYLRTVPADYYSYAEGERNDS